MKKLLGIVVCSVLLLSSAAALAEESSPPKNKQAQPTDLPYQQERSPLLASSLSIIPGLGQVYNEQYGTGALYFTATAGLYMAALYYSGVFREGDAHHVPYEAVFLFAIAGGLHAISIFDAGLEAARVNENLERWSVMVGPQEGGFSVGYAMRF